MKFELTENHLLLLQRMYIRWNDAGYDGAPEVDLKRPYGNSDVASDVYEIINGEEMPLDEDEEYDEHTVRQMLDLHEQMATALQIVLCTRSFEPGLYEKQSDYRALSWKKIS